MVLVVHRPDRLRDARRPRHGRRRRRLRPLLYRVSGTLASGDELGMWNRATFCFRKIDGEWRITHEHDSVPFDPETGQASTTLEPA